MNINDFLVAKLKHSAVLDLNDFEQEKLKKLGMLEYIKATLTSKKFRKFPYDNQILATIDRIVEDSIQNTRPIPFVFPFGGYKHYVLQNFPYADWADFFFLAYYIEYISRVAAAYKPGVIFYVLSDDAAIELMDNIKREDLEIYIASFKALIAEFSKYLPANIKLELVRTVPDLYSSLDEYLKALIANKKLGADLIAKLDKADYERKYIMSNFNIQWQGKADWTKLSEEEQKQKIIDGMIYHDCVVNDQRRGKFVRGGDKIVLFTNRIPNALALGMTKNSVTKFWTGEGILEDHGDGYQDRVVSPEQSKALKGQLSKVKVDVLALRGFDTISIYKGRLNYKK